MPHLNSELEEIFTGNEKSVSLMVNPDLRHLFFWHFHPEFELVYIEGTDGTRHVGSHLSKYSGSDLVLIGSNIPHLNFDYGVNSSYQKRVIHFKEDFLSEGHSGIVEFSAISQLLTEAAYGLAFGPATKLSLRNQILSLKETDQFQLTLDSLSILNKLAKSKDITKLHDSPVQGHTGSRDHIRLKNIYAFVESHFMEKISNKDAADVANLSYEAFSRYFKKMTKLTFTEFVNQYRIEKAKRLLLQDYTVTETCYDCGFESLSYFNRIFKKLTGQNPIEYKRGM